MAHDNSENINLLKKPGPFSWAGPKDLQLLEAACEEISFEEGSILGWEGDLWDAVVLVKSGCLRFESLSEPSAPLFIGPGESIFWEKVIQPGILSGTLKGQTTGTLLILHYDALKSLLSIRPTLKYSLAPHRRGHSKIWSVSAWNALVASHRTENHGWKSLLPPKAQVLFFSRKSFLTVWISGFPYFLIFWVSMILGIMLSWDTPPSSAATTWFLPGVGMLLGFLGWIIKVLDWSNDFLVLTKSFLLVKEMDLFGWKSQITRLPISQIQTMEISREGFWNFLFGLSNVSIKSSAFAQGIHFSALPQAQILQQSLTTQLESMKIQTQGAKQEALRKALENHFGVAKPIKILKPSQLPKEKQPIKLNWRKEEPEGIRYRRHPFLLFLKIIPWISLSGVIATGLILLAIFLKDLFLPGFILGSLLLVFLFFIIWYQVTDWTNDSFLVSGSMVLAHHRKPLWFGEEKKEIEIGKIQEMTVEKQGIFSLLMGFGNLKIQTAGAGGPLIFDYVPHPEWIQGELAQAKANWERKTGEAKDKKQYDDLAAFVDVYQKAKDDGLIK